MLETASERVMDVPLISAVLGAFLLLLQQTLMLNVGMHRFKTSIGVGVGADQHLERKSRQHGNLAENAAIFVVVLALLEMRGAPTAAVAGFAGVFAAARVSHMLGFMSLAGSHNPGQNPLFVVLRASGAFATAFAGIGLAGYLAYLTATDLF